MKRYYFLVIFGPVQTDYRQTERETGSDAYEPTVQNAQVGSKTMKYYLNLMTLGCL